MATRKPRAPRNDSPAPSRCRKCNARCCRYLCIPVGKPDYYEDFDNIRWYLLHEGVTVHVTPEGDWYVRIDNRCRMLREGPGGPSCKDYVHRPLACRQLSPESCDFAVGRPDYDEFFRTARQLDAYARRMLGELEYKAGQDRCGLRQPRAASDTKPRGNSSRPPHRKGRS